MVPSNRKQAPRLIQARTTSVHQFIVRVKLKQRVFAWLGLWLEIAGLIEHDGNLKFPMIECASFETGRFAQGVSHEPIHL